MQCTKLSCIEITINVPKPHYGRDTTVNKHGYKNRYRVETTNKAQCGETVDALRISIWSNKQTKAESDGKRRVTDTLSRLEGKILLTAI